MRSPQASRQLTARTRNARRFADDAELLGFYRRNGFRPTGIDGDLSLYLKISTVRKLLGARST